MTLNQDPLDNPKKQNVVIQNVTDSIITLKLDGATKQIPNDIDELRKQMQSRGETTFQSGEKIYNIGEIDKAEFKTIINHYYQESKRAYYLRIFLMIFVPLLALGGAYWLYQYQSLKQPISLTVKIRNQSPASELGDPKGKLILNFGDNSVTQEIEETETLFKGIPSNFRKQPVQLRFEAPGFISKDSGFLIGESILFLPVFRNNDLGIVAGTIYDEQNNPVDHVRISIGDLDTYTDAAGRFLLSIPFSKQRLKQRLEVFKTGYQKKDIETPVIPNEMVRLILEKISIKDKS